MGFAMTVNKSQHNIVEEVLGDYLQGEDLNSVVNLWDHQYSRQPLDKLSYFVFEIATTSTLRSLRKEILSDLKAKLREVENLAPVETFVEKVEVQATQVSEEVSTQEAVVEAAPVAGLEVVETFLQHIKQNLKDESKTDLKVVVEEHLLEVNLPKPITDEVLNWALYEMKLKDLNKDLEHIRQTVNVMYSVLCEYFGPVKSDRLMAQAVNLTEQQFPAEDIKAFL